jgi:hypothetical protein
MAVTHMPTPSRPSRSVLAAGLLLLGSAGVAAAWALLAVALDRQCSWMAVVAALDAILLLRMARVAPGLTRAALAVAATALAIALANWWIAGAQVGQTVGLLAWQSIPKLGWFHGWTLLTLANHGADLAWYGFGLFIAAWAGR